MPQAEPESSLPESSLPESSTSDLSRLRIDRDRTPQRRRRRRFPVVGVAVAGALIAAVLIVFSTDLLPFRRPLVVVALARATESGASRGGRAPVLSAAGYVVARVRAAVAPEVTGRLVELRVDVGDKVKKGDLIGRLADEDIVARERQAVAEVAAAAATVTEEEARRDDLAREARRQRELLARGLTSQSAHDAAQTAAAAAEARVGSAVARLETARASLRVVRAQLEKMRIHAPFSGTILEKNAELGEIVGPTFGGSSASGGGGVPVVTMADLGSVEVEVDVNETYISRVEPGLEAEIILDAYPDHVYTGVVRQIVPTADRQKATVQVKVGFRERDDRVLPEMGARVSFLSRPDAGGQASGSLGHGVQVWVPKEAIRRGAGGETAVFIVRGDRVAEARVEVGPQMGGDVQILSGLNPGERVVLGENPALKPGQRVRVRES